MKKIIITLICIAISNILLSQKTTEWSNWTSASQQCFRGIEWRVKRTDYNESAKKWMWYVDFRNRYNIKVSFSYAVEEKSGIDRTNNRTTVEAGAIDHGWWTLLATSNNQMAINIKIDKVCFHHPDGFDQCSNTNNKGYASFADCDINGRPNFKVWDGNKSSSIDNSNSTNSNSNTSTAGTIDEQLKELSQKRNDLCREVAQFDKNTYDNICDSWQGRDPIQSKEKSLLYLKEDIRKLQNVVNANSKNGIIQSQANEKALAESRAAEQKAAKYSEYMNSGESALNNNEFDNAISNFTNAQQYASSEQEMSAAVNAVARAQRAKADAARVARTTEKRKAEQQQNDATIAAASSFAGIMAMINDAHSPGKFAVKFQVGLGYGSTGIITNSAFNQKSTIKSSNQALFMLGLKLGFANNKGISFQLNPLLNIGVNALQLGIDGSSTAYGGTGTLFIAKKALSKIKLFAEGGYLNTTGIYNYDQAVAEGATSTSDNVEEATYEYSTIKYGGGIMFNLIADGKETFIKPGIFFETPSFLQKPTKPVMVGNLQVNIVSFILLDVSYSKNYFIPGRLGYKNNFKTEDKNFWSIKLIRQGKLK